MNQQLRILIYFVLIGAMALALVHFIPFKYQPAHWRLSIAEETTTADIDSLPLKLAEQIEKVDSTHLAIEKEKKDTVITHNYLSCPSLFLKQLKSFNQTLLKAPAAKASIRILHLGDSQLEGDRITSTIREAFQSRFGGGGPGLTTVFDPRHYNSSVWIDNEGSWQSHKVYDRRTKLADKAYGLMGQTATLNAQSLGEFKVSATKWAEKHAASYQKIRLFIAPHADTLHIKGEIKRVEILNDSLPPSEDLTEINWEFEQLSPAIRFKLSSNSDIHILGCALDSVAGVSVDNIALRGQSTPLLHRTNGDLFKAMGEQLNIGLVIFQFGTNIIPTVAPNYRFYQVQLAKQFELLKTYLPDVPVIVVGIADAAHATEDGIKSYTHLPRINQAQKAIALKYNFAFFDLYNAMGGQGAILEWANQKPPLALTDYIHFSRLGGKEAANYLIKALWEQFNRFNAPDTCLLTQPPQPWQRF